MKIIIAPNAFKGTLTALEAGEIIASEIQSNYPESSIEIVPIADGGDGTCELLAHSLTIAPTKVWGLNAIGKPAFGSYFLDQSKAYIDVSTFSGLGKLSIDEIDPKVASTFGTGQIIKHAIDRGANEIVLGLGGSATIDLGIGILQALGISFLDENGRDIIPFSADLLSKIKHIQKSPKIPKVQFTCLCDVRNTFRGPEGAIPVFGPQKGLKKESIPSVVQQNDFLINLLFNKGKLVFEDKPGFGAAGGIAVGLTSFFETKIETGASYFFEKINLERKVKEADLIITGEGKYDFQSRSGKACFELLQLTKKNKKPIVLITSGDEAEEEDFTSVYQLPDLDFSKDDYKNEARKNLASVAKNIQTKKGGS